MSQSDVAVLVIPANRGGFEASIQKLAELSHYNIK